MNQLQNAAAPLALTAVRPVAARFARHGGTGYGGSQGGVRQHRYAGASLPSRFRVA